MALRFKLVNNLNCKAKEAIGAFVQLRPPKNTLVKTLKKWADVAEVQEYDTGFPEGKVKVVFLWDILFDKFVGNVNKPEDQRISAITVHGHVFLPESLKHMENGRKLTLILNHEYWHARSRLPSTIDFERRVANSWFSKPSESEIRDIVSKRVAEELIAYLATGTDQEVARTKLKKEYESSYIQISPKYFNKHKTAYAEIVDCVFEEIVALRKKQVPFEKIQECLEEGHYPYSKIEKITGGKKPTPNQVPTGVGAWIAGLFKLGENKPMRS